LQYIQLYGCYASCYSMVFGLAMSVCTSVRMNAIVEYLDYQIPVTQLMGAKGNGDMQAAKRD